MRRLIAGYFSHEESESVTSLQIFLSWRFWGIHIPGCSLILHHSKFYFSDICWSNARLTKDLRYCYMSSQMKSFSVTYSEELFSNAMKISLQVFIAFICVLDDDINMVWQHLKQSTTTLVTLAVIGNWSFCSWHSQVTSVTRVTLSGKPVFHIILISTHQPMT